MAAYIVFETGHTFGPSMLYPVYRLVVNTITHLNTSSLKPISTTIPYLNYLTELAWARGNLEVIDNGCPYMGLKPGIF